MLRSEMRTTISNGTELYETVEDKLKISPIGIIPLEKNEGYFFLSSTFRLHAFINTG